MTASLPEPGSVWLHRNHGRAGRVLIVDETEVILHKVEIAMIDGDPTVSWLGAPEEFAAAFEPHPETYPKTAGGGIMRTFFLKPIGDAKHRDDAACPDAGWKPLSRKQKTRLVLLAKKGWEKQGSGGVPPSFLGKKHRRDAGIPNHDSERHPRPDLEGGPSPDARPQEDDLGMAEGTRTTHDDADCRRHGDPAADGAATGDGAVPDGVRGVRGEGETGRDV